MARLPVSARVIISYVLDWVIIIAIAAVGGGFSRTTPSRRPFDLTDRSISFPLLKESISSSTLIIVGLVAPAIIVFIVSLILGLGPRTGTDATSRAPLIRRKLWELNAGWMGLGLTLAIAFTVTNGIKTAVGKPRPDLLARCMPDLTRRLASAVGGIGTQVDEGITLYTYKICRQTNMSVLNDGFQSFPSGHSSFSFAGMTYLALFLCAKMGITIPFLRYDSMGTQTSMGASPLRSQAAAPPTYLLVFPLVPIGTAIYITSTRYAEFFHHGFDCIAGAILGIASAWFAFRWYHLPITRGGGWAWAPRSPRRAFGRGLGYLTYAEVADPVESHADIESEPRQISTAKPSNYRAENVLQNTSNIPGTHRREEV